MATFARFTDRQLKARQAEIFIRQSHSAPYCADTCTQCRINRRIIDELLRRNFFNPKIKKEKP